MHNRKEWLVSFVCVLIAAALIYSALYPGEPAQEPIDEKWNIAVLLRSSTDDYWTYVRRGLDNASLEYNAKIQLHFPEHDGDVEGQIKIAYAILETNPDAFIIAANDDQSFAGVLEEASRRRIPVIAVDSRLTSGPIATYIGANNEAYGRAAMQEMAKLLQNNGKIIMVNYVHSGINGRAREFGATDELKQYTDIELVDQITCTADIKICQEEISSSIEKHDVDGILSLITSSSLSSALALKQLDHSHQIKMVGFDSSTQLLELLQEGQLESLFVQNAFSLGYLGVRYAVEAANGKSVAPTYNMGMTMITRDNMFWLKNQKLLYPLVK